MTVDDRFSLLRLARLGLIMMVTAACAVAPLEPSPSPTSIPPTPTTLPTSVPASPVPTDTALTPVPIVANTVPPRPTAIPTTLIHRLDGSRVLFVLYRSYWPPELDIPRATLEDLGVTALVASLESGVVKGQQDGQVVADFRLADVHGGDYDAVIYVGGGGYEHEEPEGQRVAREAAEAGKIVAAICVAPLCLARAGVLEGRRATVALGSQLLEEMGAIYTSTAVERDGQFITAKSPGDVQHFSLAIAAALAE
jgi:protease I